MLNMIKGEGRSLREEEETLCCLWVGIHSATFTQVLCDQMFRWVLLRR
mgnify:CR=1 FL=1